MGILINETVSAILESHLSFTVFYFNAKLK